MALSVTGAGLTIPNIDVSRAARMDWNTVAEGMGKFAQGVRKDLANQEYADLLEKARRIKDIQAEISKLESDNKAMQDKLDAMQVKERDTTGLANFGMYDTGRLGTSADREQFQQPSFDFNWGK